MPATLVGPVARIAQVRKTMDHLPPFHCRSLTKGHFDLCGACFGMLGDGPATNGEEIWVPGTDRSGAFHYDVVARDARCHRCGGRAWPAD
jgi:hypothetical protein